MKIIADKTPEISQYKQKAFIIKNCIRKNAIDAINPIPAKIRNARVNRECEKIRDTATSINMSM